MKSAPLLLNMRGNFLSVIFCIAVLPNLNAQKLDQKLNQALLETSQGGIVELPDFISSNFPLVDYEKMILPGPQYLISDDPEYIRIPEAIAMQEAVQPGAVRLYIYNVNGVEKPRKMDRKITAVIKNNGQSTMHLRMLKYSSQKPSANYYKIGKEGLADFFASNIDKDVITVAPGETVPIDQRLEEQVVKYNELVHGFYEFVINQPAEISILQTSPSTPGAAALDQIEKVLPPKSHSGAGRGLFGVSNYQITNNEDVIDTKDGPVQIIVADGESDPWVKGKEGSTGKQASLAGNYGVMYEMELKWKSSDGKGLALVSWNSRAGNNRWCGGMAASMVVSEGKFEDGIIQIPKDQLVTKAAPEAVLIQIFTPAEDSEEQTIKMTYSPPGASCLPTPLIFIPVDLE